jgi:hypothetical protein
MDRPTGIIRTLPSLYNDNKNVGYRRYVRSIRELRKRLFLRSISQWRSSRKRKFSICIS